VFLPWAMHVLLSPTSTVVKGWGFLMGLAEVQCLVMWLEKKVGSEAKVGVWLLGKLRHTAACLC
jgi:hypothetical protein